MTPSDRSFVFVGGLHRSGTSVIYHTIGTHPKISRLTDTCVLEDEGQFLQSVYPKDQELGGPERFGLHVSAHLTESSPLVSTAKKELFRAWSPYWDLSKHYFCEKTPSNIVRSRFLQAVFPTSSFIFVSRHPVAYALATLKWNHRVLLPIMIENWLACQGHLKQDLPHLRRSLVLRYEEINLHPERTCQEIEEFLGLRPGMDASLIKQGLNDPYFSSWQRKNYRRGPNWWGTVAKRYWNEMEIGYVEWRYERAINTFGYSFHELA